MQSLASTGQIISLARSLGIHSGNPVDEIKSLCVQKVGKLIGRGSPPSSIDEIERIVCEKLNLSIREVWTEDDIDRAIEHYARLNKDPVFATLRDELRPDTFATLIQRRNRPGETGNHFVAIIDCRGEKAHRRFFTKWHEIAHILTMVEQWELPLHRSTTNKDPLESMMDVIAGEIGFYQPIFQPMVDQHLGHGPLTFRGIEELRGRFCPEASFQATMNACAKFVKKPVVILEAEPGFKKAEIELLNQPSLFRGDKPSPKLRVVSSKGNPLANEQGIHIPLRMRVPLTSQIMRAFEAEGKIQHCGEEDLSAWVCSNGSCLRPSKVWVEAKSISSHILAIITAIR